jgi:hypothetical protein
MTSSPRAEEQGDGIALRLAEVVAVVAAIVSTFSAVGPVFGLGRGVLLAVILPTSAGAFFALVLGRRAVATRTIRMEIAIGGSQGVGKTVYTNVVASRLGESESSDLRFTPEARTAQQVYNTISGLRRERWPPSTSDDHIDRYRGKVELLHQPTYRRLVQGRLGIDLELGDSAGELWDEVAHRSSKGTSWLIDSTFFEYVGESSALLYFISAETVRGDPDRIADHVDDLLSTLQVLRSIESQATPQLAKPIAVVISKADLLNRAELAALRGLFDNGWASSEQMSEATDLKALDRRFVASMERLERLTIVMNRQVRDFEGFVTSALLAAQQRVEIAEDPLARVERPIEWAIDRILAS